MRFIKIYIILLFIISNFFLAGSTSIFELSLQELSLSAEKIVQARVTAVVSKWNKDSSAIFTYIRMNIVDDLIGGDKDNEIIIRQPGGIVGNTSLFVEGISNYIIGEEDVLFLLKDKIDKGTFRTLGMYQGKYKIFIDNKNVKRVKQDNSNTARFYRRRGRGSYLETGNNKTLDDFKSSILQYINTK
ncbi:MAG: hypothetical protein PVI26_09295 [Chitinispirillia bacterium]|jgi:hypothetical protein